MSGFDEERAGIERVMNFVRRLLFAAALLGGTVFGAHVFSGQLRLIEIDPGHSHLSGLHAKSLPGISDEVHLYSPLTSELAAHLAALARFNNRSSNPTRWTVRLFAGPDYLERLKQEPAGNIVALSGRNEKKIDYIATALEYGQNVFADKPWIVSRNDFPKLEKALELAKKKRLVTYDWMTLRGNVAYQLQRDLIEDESVFGIPAQGSPEEPAVRLQNLHALLKFSNGIPQQRPASFLDVRQQGEGLADVGTHLADLVQWTLFPTQSISYRKDIHVLKAEHSPLFLKLDQLTQLTGETAWPEYLKQDLVDGKLKYLANGSCVYTIRGVHVQLKVGWQYQAPTGAQDSYFTSFLGTRARVELRAGTAEHYVPEIYVAPVQNDKSGDAEAKLKSSLARLTTKYPGLSMEKMDGIFHILLPKSDRLGDDLFFIFTDFRGFVSNYQTFPPSENESLLAKYYITTTAVEMAQASH